MDGGCARSRPRTPLPVEARTAPLGASLVSSTSSGGAARRRGRERSAERKRGREREEKKRVRSCVSPPSLAIVIPFPPRPRALTNRPTGQTHCPPPRRLLDRVKVAVGCKGGRWRGEREERVSLGGVSGRETTTERGKKTHGGRLLAAASLSRQTTPTHHASSGGGWYTEKSHRNTGVFGADGIFAACWVGFSLQSGLRLLSFFSKRGGSEREIGGGQREERRVCGYVQVSCGLIVCACVCRCEAERRGSYQPGQKERKKKKRRLAKE